MGVDHGRSYLFMAQKLLYGSDIVSILQQMGGEGMAKCVTTGPPNY
jgi:hypothetical protein